MPSLDTIVGILFAIIMGVMSLMGGFFKYLFNNIDKEVKTHTGQITELEKSMIAQASMQEDITLIRDRVEQATEKVTYMQIEAQAEALANTKLAEKMQERGIT